MTWQRASAGGQLPEGHVTWQRASSGRQSPEGHVTWQRASSGGQSPEGSHIIPSDTRPVVTACGDSL